MILRLVYSFLFFSLVTGNQRLEDPKKAARTDYCANEICVCQDELESVSNRFSSSPSSYPNSHKTEFSSAEDPPPFNPYLNEESHYGAQKGHHYPPYISSGGPSRIEAKSYDVEYVSDDSPVPRPVQLVSDETYTEKTICFTPSMVHRMVKAALEYVSQIPSDVGNVIDKLDQELNRMSDTDSLEDQIAKKPSYPLDSKSIFQMLNKPRTESRTNLILQYELPGAQEPQCREALEKLIEIAYNAYMELEQQPQCREYLYRFATQQTEDRPRGHLEYGPDLKSVIATILEQIDQNKAKNSPDFGHAEYYTSMNGYEVPSLPELPIPQIHEHNIPQLQDINIPQINELNIPQYHDITEIRDIKIPQIHNIKIPQIQEFNIPSYHDITEIRDIKIPQIHEIKIPQIQEFNIPSYHDITEIRDVKIPQIHDFKIPQIQEFNIPQYQDITEIRDIKMPKIHDIKIPQIQDFNIPQYQDITEIRDIKLPKIKIPQIQDFKIPQIQDFKIPQIQDFKIPQIQDFNIPQYHDITEIRDVKYPQLHEIQLPQVQEFNVPQYDVTQIREYNIPQIQEINIPQIHETIQETVQEMRPLQPEETVNVILQVLQNNDNFDTVNLFDRLMNIVEENQNNFHPQVYETLLTLLSIRKERHVPRFNEILYLLLDSVRNKQWPWSENVTEHILTYLLPDRNGNLDARIVDIILNLYNKPTNENQVEFILSILRRIKEGSLDSRSYEIILNLINSHQNNMLHPDHIETLLNLMRPHTGIIDESKELDVIDDLSRWNEMGLTPNQVNTLVTLLKPDVNGHTDQKTIDITHFLLKQKKYFNPRHLSFILSFLHPENGIPDARRIDLIHLILNQATSHPQNVEFLINLLLENTPAVLNSRFLEILLFLNSNRLLTSELLETLTTLLNDEVNGQLSDQQVKTLFFQLSPFKQSNPKIVVDILSLLSQGGLHGNIVEWLETVNHNVGIPSRDSTTSNLQALIEKVENMKGRLIQESNGPANEFRVTDDGYTVPNSPDNDFFVIFKWLESQGLLNPDQGGANNDLVNKLLKILEMGERELGVVELTYMLKHEKPLVYQPVYYVKYRLPILSFISNMKTLLVENPQLTADPLKLLQELIIISNVTEVSPNLQGYPKEEILKLTFNDGDLVQAKILDEQNLNLNEQITYVHGLNVDISPEEILQLNRVNEAKYYPNIVQIKETYPEKVTVHEINKYVEFPPVHYKRTKEASEADSDVPAPTLTPYEKKQENNKPSQSNAKNAQTRSPK